MTKHRKPEQWIDHILEVAAEELVKGGYSGLTMDAIALRTALSKGGVYRFFPNKQAVALALFTKHYKELLEFDVQDAIDWNISISDTIHRILFGQWEGTSQDVNQRIWVELISETQRDTAFFEERQRLLLLLRGKFRLLLERLALRDCLEIDVHIISKLDTTLFLGIALMEGLVLQGAGGTYFGEQSTLARRFIEVMLNDVFGVIHVGNEDNRS